jgi:serine/threonine-protein kinase ATR
MVRLRIPSRATINRNLFLDSLRTHIQGVLVRNPDWAGPLSSFQVEGALMANDWATVLDVVSESRSKSSEVALARVFLAMRSGDETAISSALTAARSQMGEPIKTAGERGYRRAYDAILSLHILKDIETIHKSSLLKEGTQIAMTKLRDILDSRFEATLPSFRAREPILNMHRAAFSLG